MNFTIALAALIVLLGVFSVNAEAPSAVLYIQQRAETALYEQMIKSRSAPMPRTAISVCHPHYANLLQNILDTYENELQACENVENVKLEALATAEQQSRDDTTSILKDVCGSLDVCEAKNKNLEFFDCVDQSGDKNTRNVWKASKDSSESSARIKEQIHAIKYQTGRCTSEAERKYIVETAKATDEMMECYTNGGVIPNPPSTEAPGPEPAPPASTEAPGPAPPASTEAPEPAPPASTEAPEPAPPASTEAPEPAPPASTEAPGPAPPASTEAPEPAPPASTEAPGPAPPASTEAPEPAPPASTEAPGPAPPASTEAPEPAPPASTEAPEPAPPASTEAPGPAPPASTEAPGPPAPEEESDEQDQVEELEEKNIKNRLENFMRSWGKSS